MLIFKSHALINLPFLKIDFYLIRIHFIIKLLMQNDVYQNFKITFLDSKHAYFFVRSLFLIKGLSIVPILVSFWTFLMYLLNYKK